MFTDYALEIIYSVCVGKECVEIRAKWPAIHVMKESAALFENNLPHGKLLTNIFAVKDEGLLSCADYMDRYKQNGPYEG